VTQEKRCGPKTGTSDLRIQEARRLRKQGATDADLLNLGFGRREIARSFVPNSVSIHQRCRKCGALAVVDADRVCMACELISKLKREGLQEPEPYEIVRRGRPPITKPINMEHPAILKPKGS
jgi:hypothetical protein